MKKGEGKIPEGYTGKRLPGINQENVESRSRQNSPDPQTGESISLLPLLAVNFIGTLGFSIVLPFLVFLVNRLGGNAFIYGLASSMYPAFQLIGAPILGRWSDIYGRKKILFLSQLGTLLSWIIFLGALFLPVVPLFKVDSKILGAFTFTLPLAVLFFARAFDGLTGGNMSVANAYLADITAEKDRNRNFGKMSISSNLGFIVGPALAGILSVTQYGDAAPVLGAIVISLIGTLLILFYIPENKECSLEEPADAENTQKILWLRDKGMQNHTRKAKKTYFQGDFETSEYSLYARPLFPDLSRFQYLLHCFSPACNSSPGLEHCTNGSLLYGSERPPDNRTGSCASESFKKVFGCNPYNLRKPDAWYKFFTVNPWKPLPDLPCNRIFRTWRRAYVAFFSLSFIKNCREKIPGYSTGVCQQFRGPCQYHRADPWRPFI